MSPSSTPCAATPGPPRAGSAPRWATSRRTGRSGTPSTRSRAATTWWTRRPRRSWPRRRCEAVYDLENRGLPFSRTPDGKIDQRRFGGHTRNFGEAPVRRSCYAADRTGHMILQTLYQQCIKNEVTFFDEFQVVDVLLEGRRCRGVVGPGAGHRRAARLPRQGGALRHRRLRPDVPHHLQRLRQHRRRAGRAGPPRGAPGGHGVLPVPPHRHPRPGHPHHRGGARRGRDPAQPPRGALHGALRARRCWTWRPAT